MRNTILILILSLVCRLAVAQDISILPNPLSVTSQPGYFVCQSTTPLIILSSEPELQWAATFFSQLLEKSMGHPLAIISGKNSSKGSISLSVNPQLAEEEYYLTIQKARVKISGGSPKAVFYALQSLRQLLPVGIERAETRSPILIPCLMIHDKPEFAYRGAMLDVCRHFFTVDQIKGYIDMLALHKINTFHWHLTDDQGWRIEIKKYPLLTEIGSRRAQTAVGAYRAMLGGDHTPYGGYYTQEQIREVVRYAQERFITIIPEIEMPGHAVAALAAYPYLGCRGTDYHVKQTWGVFHEVFCPGKESTFEFLEDVLTEVIALFPSRYIHIGGDECPKKEWMVCPRCQQRKKENGLKDEMELQSYFIHRIEALVQKQGREIIGWDEILEGGLSRSATVMSWRGKKGGVEAAKSGNSVVMAPNSHCYLDYYQSKDKSNEPLAIGNFLPIEKVYDLDPFEGLTPEESRHIIGIQGNLWTEYIGSMDHVYYMVLPRLAALADLGWGLSRKNYQEYRKRQIYLFDRYEALGYRYAKHIMAQ